MKNVKIIVAPLFLVMSVLAISSQTVSFPNELNDYKLYRRGKIEKLIMLVSDERDVVKIFGTNCTKACDYDDKWQISFDFLRKGEFISETGDGRERRFYLPAKYAGKLSGIHFIPRKQSIFGTSPLLSKFKEGFASQTGDELHPGDAVSLKTFTDNFGLGYVVCASTSESGKYRSGDVFSINYEIDREELFGVNRYYENKNNPKRKTKPQ